MKKLLVCGGRHFTRADLIRQQLEALHPDVVVTGAAPGADTLAEEAARALGILVHSYPADWATHGRDAGPLRNQKMLDVEHRPDEPIELVLAFPDLSSVGTWDMVRRAKAAGIPCKVVRSPTGTIFGVKKS